MNPNFHVYSTEESESNSVHKIDITVNMSKVKDKRYEELAVTDIEVIKAPGYFKLF